MARYGLTIQKKFLLLILVVGLIPAALGVIITIKGGEYTFAKAMSSALDGRTTEVSRQIDLLCDHYQDTLRKALFDRGGDLEALRLDAAALGGIEALVRYRSAEDFQILPIASREDPTIHRLHDRKGYFEGLTRAGRVPPQGFFDDIPLPAGEGNADLGWIVITFAPEYGGLIAFVMTADFLVQQIRSATIGQDDVVQIFSRRGYMLTTLPGPPGMLDHARTYLSGQLTELSGVFNLRPADPFPAAWHLVGFSSSRRLARLSSERRSGPPWLVLVSYDMENFLGQQATLVWFSVFAALFWALLLMISSILAAQRIVGPVKVLRQQAEAMAQGNLNARARVRTHDEIQDLAHAFNTMALKLRQSYQRITSFNQELEQKVIERTRDLARANQKLIQTEKYAATGRLAANLAHEINNPLGIIKNYMRLVASNLAQAAGGRRRTDINADRVKVINEELDRIARIVRQLLDLHRPVEQQVRAMDVNALLADILVLMEKGLASEKIQVRRDFDPNLPALMVASDLLRQVLLNLLRNAQDAMEFGGVLTVKTESRRQWDETGYIPVVSISIMDTGCGIRQGDLGRIFDPFFTTKSPDKGTGLGLSISYGIIQMYKGSIEAFSEWGKGTTMVVTIPVEPAKNEAPHEEAAIPSVESEKLAAGVSNAGQIAEG
jgi:signal transduction histidine kinase